MDDALDRGETRVSYTDKDSVFNSLIGKVVRAYNVEIITLCSDEEQATILIDDKVWQIPTTVAYNLVNVWKKIQAEKKEEEKKVTEKEKAEDTYVHVTLDGRELSDEDVNLIRDRIEGLIQKYLDNDEIEDMDEKKLKDYTEKYAEIIAQKVDEERHSSIVKSIHNLGNTYVNKMDGLDFTVKMMEQYMKDAIEREGNETVYKCKEMMRDLSREIKHVQTIYSIQFSVLLFLLFYIATRLYALG